MKPLQRTARGRGALALIAGGALIVVGHALSVDMGSSAHRYVTDLAHHRPLHVAGGLVTATAALLLSIGLRATARSLSARGRRFGAVVATAASIGAVGMALGLAMVAMVMGTLVGGDRRLAVDAYHVLNHATLASLPFLVAYLFTLGVLALAASLLLAGGRQRWIGLALLVGTAIDFVSPSGGALTAALHVPQAVAFALLGAELARGGFASEPVSKPVTRAEAATAAAGVLELLGN